MKRLLLLITICSFTGALNAQQDSTAQPKNKQKGEPLEGMDCRWWNGGDRRSEPTMATKYFTPIVMVDANYTHSFNDPNDNTVVGSTALARNNEIEVSAVHLGGEFNYKNARAHIVTQFGTRTTLIPRNDYSVYKGQYQLDNVYRNIAEANAGYHINRLHGINIDAGLFMSYIGLNSYYQAENWEYQASFTSDNTPWFFSGLRLQLFLTKKLKVEPWLVNGWQSYGMFNKQPGVGGNITWCPNENVKMLTNDYYGTDAAGIPDRKRFHSDNSLMIRYFKKPESKGISQMAFSLTSDFGYEKGGGVNGFKDGDSVQGPKQYFFSVMFYNRTWFAKNKFACTFGGGYMSNPGRYLVLLPVGQASALPNPYNPTSTAGAYPFTANPGDKFEGFDCSANFDWMPNEHFVFRVEYVHRQSSVNYFAGRGGVTSPTGYSTTPLPAGWKPDLVKSEDRIIFAWIFRL